MIEINNNYIMTDVYDILIELRRQLDINGVKRFNKIIKTNNNLQTNCPFHKEGQEKKPSFGISTKDGVCHCFGCGWVGSFSEMVSNLFGYDDFGNFGNKWLVKNFLSVSVENRPDILEGFYGRNNVRNSDVYSRNINRNYTSNGNIQYITEEELDSYRYIHPYMYKRKLSDEIIELFDIGYDSKTECITFPIRDINGNTLFIARRSVKTKFFNYPENVEKPVYGLYEISKLGIGYYKYDEIIICESMIDALTCWVYGRPAVALNGLGNDLQFKQLNNMPCRKFILATDMDEAGLKARKRIKNALKNKLVTEYIWDIKVAKDINDMTQDYFLNLKEMF